MSFLYIVAAVLVALWLIGFLTSYGGGLIHIILILAVLVFLYEVLVRGKRLR